MKKLIIYTALIFVVFACKDETVQEPSLISLIPGKYGVAIWYETEPGTNNRIRKGGGEIIVSIDAINNSVTIRGRPTANQNFIYFPKYYYREITPVKYYLFQQKNDIDKSGRIERDMTLMDKSIISVGCNIDFTDSLGRVYTVIAIKLGR